MPRREYTPLTRVPSLTQNQVAKLKGLSVTDAPALWALIDASPDSIRDFMGITQDELTALAREVEVHIASEHMAAMLEQKGQTYSFGARNHKDMPR